MAQADQVLGRQPAGRGVVEPDMADGRVAGPLDLEDPAVSVAGRDLCEVAGGHALVAVDHGYPHALGHRTPQQLRLPRRRHRDQLGNVLRQEDVQRLRLQAGLALRREEQRLVAELACPALDAEHHVADVAITDALHDDADERGRLRPEPSRSRGRPVLHPLCNFEDSRLGGCADRGVVLQRAAHGGGRHTQSGRDVFHRDPRARRWRRRAGHIRHRVAFQRIARRRIFSLRLPGSAVVNRLRNETLASSCKGVNTCIQTDIQRLRRPLLSL